MVIYRTVQHKTKLKKIQQDGSKKLQIITDFDRTLTKCYHNGRRIPSTIALIREGRYLTPDYPKKAFALFDKYHPSEINPHIPLAKKKRLMEEWWTAHIKLLSKSGMGKNVLDDIVKRYPKIFRGGALNFLQKAKLLNIPVLIFSSGLGDLISMYLTKERCMTSNIHVISNFFAYRKDKVIGYKSEVIHTFNKNESMALKQSYGKNLFKRKNILLLGDSLGDLGMADGFRADCILKIGFLNENITRNLPIYKKYFDIIITGDSNFNELHSILDSIR